EGWTFEGPKGTTTVRASDHALVQPMYQVRLVADGDAWVPEPVAEVPGEDVAPAEAGRRGRAAHHPRARGPRPRPATRRGPPPPGRAPPRPPGRGARGGRPPPPR